MKDNKLLKMMLIIMIVITLVSVVALVVIMNFKGKEDSGEPTADEIVASSFDIPEMTTNLMDDHFVKIAFKIQTDSEKAREEAEKRDFQIKSIIIEELSEMKSEEFKGKQGKLLLEKKLQERINQLMQEGKVEKIYITSFILQ
ncbi:flagellar FliL protein [Thermolongibacillus altinsuensis]|uniref:Flagellar protein FliL n=1 Tax=Thermolongibacillus altinsuensis TaxID=575256 RepID=A0A4R1QIL1_9BACL|nr:flagellar basal body-associated protein FliL [Thermolongibacillus altinsuensis]TCL50380.1 flagellar FliL protein [Thermolongibacillus altinsuensis]